MNTAVTGTAVGPMVIAAVDRFEEHRSVRTARGRILPVSGRLAVAAARWRPVRNALVSATEKKIPGLWASMLCRKRYIDDRLDVTEARTAVVLGAGFDTRGCGGWDGTVFEVDLPANVKVKHDRIIALFGSMPPRLTLVPVDFEEHSLANALAETVSRR